MKFTFTHIRIPTGTPVFVSPHNIDQVINQIVGIPIEPTEIEADSEEEAVEKLWSTLTLLWYKPKPQTIHVYVDWCEE